MARKTGRGRYLRSEISVDPNFNALAREDGEFAALLFTLMIPHANDQATVTGHPEALRLLVIPGLAKSAEDVQRALEAIERHGLIEHWDRRADVVYFKPHSFYACQHYIGQPKRRAALDTGATPTLAPTVTPTLAADAKGGSRLAHFESGYGAAVAEHEQRDLLPLLEGWHNDVIRYVGQRASTAGAVHLAPFVRSILAQWHGAGLEEINDIIEYERDGFGWRDGTISKEGHDEQTW